MKNKDSLEYMMVLRSEDENLLLKVLAGLKGRFGMAWKFYFYSKEEYGQDYAEIGVDCGFESAGDRIRYFANGYYFALLENQLRAD